MGTSCEQYTRRVYHINYYLNLIRRRRRLMFRCGVSSVILRDPFPDN